MSGLPENKNTTTAREVVEKTKDLAKKIAEAKAGTKIKAEAVAPEKPPPPATSGGTMGAKQPSLTPRNISTDPANRIGVLVGSAIAETSGSLQAEAKLLEQFNAQFAHFPDDAPACDVCGSITVRNGSCYKCFNCGNSMGCS